MIIGIALLALIVIKFFPGNEAESLLVMIAVFGCYYIFGCRVICDLNLADEKDTSKGKKKKGKGSELGRLIGRLWRRINGPSIGIKQVAALLGIFYVATTASMSIVMLIILFLVDALACFTALYQLDTNPDYPPDEDDADRSRRIGLILLLPFVASIVLRLLTVAFKDPAQLLPDLADAFFSLLAVSAPILMMLCPDFLDNNVVELKRSLEGGDDLDEDN